MVNKIEIKISQGLPSSNLNHRREKEMGEKTPEEEEVGEC